MKRNNKKGFTIVELVIVIAVIAILSAVLIPTFGGIVDKANKSANEQEARNGYVANYALDMADGKLDGLDNGTALPANYVFVAAEGTTPASSYYYVEVSTGVYVSFDGENFGTSGPAATQP